MSQEFFAGGIKNLGSTCSISCSLQLLLHFKPFIEMLNNSNDGLISVLKELQDDLKKTQNVISPEKLVNYFQIDKNMFIRVSDFLNNIFTQFPDFSQIISLDSLDFKDDSIFTMKNNNDKYYKMHIITLDSDNSNAEFRELIQVNEVKYYLCGFVQNFHKMSHIVLKDEKGWICCHNCSVRKLSHDSVIEMFNNPQTKVELLCYVLDVNLIHFPRKPIRFSKIQSSIQISDKMEEIPLERKHSNQKYPSSQILIKDEDFSPPIAISVDSDTLFSDESEIEIQIKDNSNIKTVKYIFFDASTMDVAIEENEYKAQGDYKEIAEKIKHELEHNLKQQLKYRFMKEPNEYIENPQSYDQNITIIFELKKMKNFDVYNFLQLKHQKENLLKVEISILKTPIKFTQTFWKEQTVKDIEQYGKTFCRQILQLKEQSNYQIFYNFHGKILKIDNSFSIIDVWMRWNDLTFFLSITEVKPKELSRLKIPYFATNNKLKEENFIKKKLNIEDTVESIITKAEKLFLEKQLKVVEFDDVNKKFIIHENKEDLCHLLGEKNLRIQSNISNDYIYFDYSAYPFAYPLSDNETNENLTKKIQNYLQLIEKIQLSYCKKHGEGNFIPENDIPKKLYDQGVFDYISVIVKD